MADVNYMMKGIQRAFERQKKQALVAEKQPPVAAKAPVVAPKQEPKKEEPLKSNLTEEEIQYYWRSPFLIALCLRSIFFAFHHPYWQRTLHASCELFGNHLEVIVGQGVLSRILF